MPRRLTCRTLAFVSLWAHTLYGRVGALFYIPKALPYNAYISRVFIFANFANLEAFAKFFQRNFWDVAHTHASVPKPRLYSDVSSLDRELKTTRYNICWKYLMNVVITRGCSMLQPRELARVTACANAAYVLVTWVLLICSAHIIVPGRVAPSAYACGCAECFREIRKCQKQLCEI